MGDTIRPAWRRVRLLLADAKVEELSPRVRMAYVTRADQIEKSLTVGIARSQTVGKVGIKKFAEELGCFPVGKPGVEKNVRRTVHAQDQRMVRRKAHPLSILI